MADSEDSFRDRQGKAQSLRDATAGFTPAFAPADTSLNASNFGTFISTVDAANASVETLASNYTTNAETRATLVKTLRDTTTQALNYVKSNKAWASQYKAAKMAGDKLRGVRPPAATIPPPPPAAGEPEVRARNRGEQAYVELAAHLNTLTGALTSCPGYAPPAAEISLSTLNGHLSGFRGLNAFISALETQLTTAREDRRRVYYDEAGLKERFDAVKSAVKGQYGQGSAQAGTVKGIKW